VPVLQLRFGVETVVYTLSNFSVVGWTHAQHLGHVVVGWQKSSSEFVEIQFLVSVLVEATEEKLDFFSRGVDSDSVQARSQSLGGDVSVALEHLKCID
jgi:hypothetical protein